MLGKNTRAVTDSMYKIQQNVCRVRIKNHVSDQPVDGNGSHGVDTGEHGCDREEVVEPAVDSSKVPLSMSRVDEVDKRVERSHGDIGESQVQQEVIGHRPHPPVSQNYPYHNQVPEHGHHQHRAVSHRPQGDPPRRLHELVAQISG